MEETLALFQSIGLSEAKAKDTVKNAAVSSSLKALIVEVYYRGKVCFSLTEFNGACFVTRQLLRFEAVLVCCST